VDHQWRQSQQCTSGGDRCLRQKLPSELLEVVCGRLRDLPEISQMFCFHTVYFLHFGWPLDFSCCSKCLVASSRQPSPSNTVWINILFTNFDSSGEKTKFTVFCLCNTEFLVTHCSPIITLLPVSTCTIYIFLHGSTAFCEPGPPHYWGFTIILRYTMLGRNPLDEWSAQLKRPLPDKTQHSQETDIHAPSGIQTRSLSKWAGADPFLRLRDHCDRHLHCVVIGHRHDLANSIGLGGQNWYLVLGTLIYEAVKLERRGRLVWTSP
jgi:hypothetical protein